MGNKEEYKSPAVIEIVAIVKDSYLFDSSQIEVDYSYEFED